MTTTFADIPEMPKSETFLKSYWEKYASDWTDNISYDSGLMVLHAKSFNDYIEEWLKNMDLFELNKGMDNAIQIGPWKIFLQSIEPYIYEAARGYMFGMALGGMSWRKTQLNMMKNVRKVGKVTWTDEVLIPVMAVEEKFHITGFQAMMSLTPSEMLSQRPGIRKSKGNVFVGGLGLGWFVSRIALRKQVKHITVIEKDKDIIDFIGPRLKKWFGDKLEIICEDAYHYFGIDGTFHKPSTTIDKDCLNKFDSIIFDIWGEYGDASDDLRWKKIIENHPRCWAWGYTARANY